MNPSEEKKQVPFHERIFAMNRMYDLPVCDVPRPAAPHEIGHFQEILEEEVHELFDIESEEDPLDRLVYLADLLGDVTVYCRSEAAKFGIPLEEVLEIIMDSNESKLGDDGKPIKDERGKFLKGPNYWKPEPKIRALLQDKIVSSSYSDVCYPSTQAEKQ